MKHTSKPLSGASQRTFTIILFALILIIGIYLRFDRLTTIPPSLSHDETAIAYNAYSILKTGKDEYGAPYPLLFRSFDDYKLPGMVYTTVPFVALFGRTELAARLPSALFGILAIIVMYVLAAELLGDRRHLKLGEFDAALIPTLMFALQPWHINFSRQLFESNGAVFWFMLGTYFLLRSRRNYREILLAGLFYVTSLYFYYSVRLVIPFMALLYLVTQWKTVTKEWKTSVVTLAICLTVFFPMGREMLSPGGWQRINTVSVVNDQNFINRKEAYTNIMAVHPTIINKIIYNRRIALLETILENYWKNIDPHNLFVTGTGTYGALYPFDMMLLPLGLLLLFSLSPFSMYVLLVWLVTGFFPGAFSLNQPNTLRTLIAAPVFAVLSGFGIIYLLEYLPKKSRVKPVVAVLLTALVIWFLLSFPKFHYAYFVNNPTNNALSFGDGNKQMVAYVRANEHKYDRIYISGYYWRPYIFLLYWGGIDPAVYQSGGNREHFGKYYFTSASWDTNGMKLMDPSFDFKGLPHGGNTLFILASPEYMQHKKEFQKLDDINGSTVKEVFVSAKLYN